MEKIVRMTPKTCSDGPAKLLNLLGKQNYVNISPPNLTTHFLDFSRGFYSVKSGFWGILSIFWRFRRSKIGKGGIFGNFDYAETIFETQKP